LARVEMSYSEGKPITAAATPAGDAANPPGALRTRFAGGREYELTFNTTSFNSTQSPAQVVTAAFAKVLEQAKIANPTSRSEIISAPGQAGAGEGESTISAGAATRLILRTDLEPDVAQAELAHLKESLSNNRDLLFERIENFGPTLAGETRTLALIATVASW